MSLQFAVELPLVCFDGDGDRTFRARLLAVVRVEDVGSWYDEALLILGATSITSEPARRNNPNQEKEANSGTQSYHHNLRYSLHWFCKNQRSLNYKIHNITKYTSILSTLFPVIKNREPTWFNEEPL